MNALQIIKNSGNTEEFSKEKLINSLVKSGASKQKAEEICQKILKTCHEGHSTKQLYRKALSYLKKESKLLASNYSMTKAISELGPDGYHFEKFICEIFQRMGYDSKTNFMAKGKCVRHEIDVLAVNHKTIYCECKFHNNINTKNDLKTALYVWARYQDIKSNPENKIDDFWLISNTKFTKDAVKYANCAGLTLLGPNTPEQHSLTNLAIKHHVFPIGTLTTLKKKYIKSLNAKDCILISHIAENPNQLEDIGIPENERRAIIREVKLLKELE